MDVLIRKMSLFLWEIVKSVTMLCEKGTEVFESTIYTNFRRASACTFIVRQLLLILNVEPYMAGLCDSIISLTNCSQGMMYASLIARA